MVALDKNPGVRPIGICETVRRIIAKAALQLTRQDVQEAAGSLQLCAVQPSGVEAAIHAVRSIFEDSSTDCVLLVDASNAFNSLNRQTALHNILHICPALAKIIINCYRSASDLFVYGSQLKSEEGTTQGDPLAMPFYALATLPLIKELASQCSIFQAWYADDSAAAGRLKDVRQWWDTLASRGPRYGYFANSNKTWLVVKESVEVEAKNLFCGTNISITSHGRPYLGAPLGTQSYQEEFVCSKVDVWVTHVQSLTKVAIMLPMLPLPMVFPACGSSLAGPHQTYATCWSLSRQPSGPCSFQP